MFLLHENIWQFALQIAIIILRSKIIRRGDREAEGARLEIVCSESYRGFESLPLRHIEKFGGIECDYYKFDRGTGRVRTLVGFDPKIPSE